MSVSVVALQDTASIIVMREGETSLFQEIEGKPQQYRKLLNGSLTHIRRRMHRVSGRRQGERKDKGKNNICHVDGMDITESCLREREEMLRAVAEEP